MRLPHHFLQKRLDFSGCRAFVAFSSDKLSTDKLLKSDRSNFRDDCLFCEHSRALLRETVASSTFYNASSEIITFELFGTMTKSFEQFSVSIGADKAKFSWINLVIVSKPLSRNLDHTDLEQKYMSEIINSLGQNSTYHVLNIPKENRRTHVLLLQIEGTRRKRHQVL